MNVDNVKDTIDHLKNHQDYPASYKELIAECNDLSDFSDEDKEWFKEHLAKKVYNSADEVIETLGLTA
jgi:hypothetical protein